MSPEVISLIGIIVGLIVIVYCAFKSVPILILAPCTAMIVALFSATNPFTFLTGPYAEGVANFAQKQFCLFLTSAVFGKIMGDSGAARIIGYKIAGLADKYEDPFKKKFIGVMSMVALGAILTYGGVTSYVLWFTSVVIAKEIYEKLDIPWNLYICIVLGSTQFTMTMAPGSPSIQNNVPTSYLGTTAMAAPVLGTIASIIAVALGTIYIAWAVKSEVKKGRGFYPDGTEMAKTCPKFEETPDMPLIICLIPSLVLLVVLNVFKQPAVTAVFCGIVVSMLLFRKNLKNPMKTLGDGAGNAVNSLMNVCVITGFGTAVASTAGYSLVMGSLDKIPGPPVFKIIIAVNVAAGITGSATSGLGIALGQLSDYFLSLGLSPQIIHRMACVSAGGLDSLPHNSGIYNSFAVSKLNHKMAYKHYFWLTVVITLIVAFICAGLVQLGIC